MGDVDAQWVRATSSCLTDATTVDWEGKISANGGFEIYFSEYQRLKPSARRDYQVKFSGVLPLRPKYGQEFTLLWSGSEFFEDMPVKFVVQDDVMKYDKKDGWWRTP